MSGTIQAIISVQRLLAGAKYDLTRTDKHPNDAHKAHAKIKQAQDTLGLIVESLAVRR